MSLVDQAREVRERITARLRELEPLVREYHELQKVAAEMGFAGSEPNSESPWTDADLAARSSNPAVAARGSSARRRSTPRRQTRQGSARRAPQQGHGDLAGRALAAVQADPGKTVADYAEALGVAPTALYQPVRQLTTEGVLVKRARQLYPG